MLFQAVLYVCIVSKIFISRPITTLRVCMCCLCVYFGFSLRRVFVLRPSFAFPPFSRLSSRRSSLPLFLSLYLSVYFAQLLRPTSSFSARMLASQSVLVVPVSSAHRSFIPFAQATLRDQGGRDRRMRLSRCICAKPPRCTRDACGIGSHETWRLRAKMRHDLSNVTRDES